MSIHQDGSFSTDSEYDERTMVNEDAGSTSSSEDGDVLRYKSFMALSASVEQKLVPLDHCHGLIHHNKRKDEKKLMNPVPLAATLPTALPKLVPLDKCHEERKEKNLMNPAPLNTLPKLVPLAATLPTALPKLVPLDKCHGMTHHEKRKKEKIYMNPVQLNTLPKLVPLAGRVLTPEELEEKAERKRRKERELKVEKSGRKERYQMDPMKSELPKLVPISAPLNLPKLVPMDKCHGLIHHMKRKNEGRYAAPLNLPKLVPLAATLPTVLPKLVPLDKHHEERKEKNLMNTAPLNTLPKLVPLNCHKEKASNTVPKLQPLVIEDNKLPKDLGAPKTLDCDSCSKKKKKETMALMPLECPSCEERKKRKKLEASLPPLIPLASHCKKNKCVVDEKELLKVQTKLPELIPLTAEEKFSKITETDAKAFGLKKEAEFSLRESTIDRMATVFRYNQSITNPGMQSLMTNGTFPLAAPTTNECKTKRSISHIKKEHRVFYDLLKALKLEDYLTKPDIAIVIPSEEALKMVKPEADGVRDVLLYHFLKVDAFAIQKDLSEGIMREIPTFNGLNKVQIQKFKDAYFINGTTAIRSDIFCPFQIYHVKPVLEPGKIIPLIPTEKPDDEKDTKSDDESESDSNEDDDAKGKPTEATFIYQSFQSSLLQNVNEKTTLKNSVLKDVALQMNKSIYSSALGVAQSTKTAITIAAFNTGKLYDDYTKQSMTDLSRIFPRRLVDLQFNKTTPVNYDSHLAFNEYQCSELTPIKKIDLLNGPVMISVKQGEGGISHLLCKFISSSRDTNTYIDVNENVLVRFDADGKLDTLSLNHDALKADGEMMPDFNHFIQLNVKEHYDSLYHTQLGKNAFDTLLMTNGVFSRGAKWVSQKAAKVGDKAKRVYQQQTSIKLRPVNNLPADINEVGAEDKDWGVEVAVKFYTKSHKPIESKSKKIMVSTKTKTTEDNTTMTIYVMKQDDVQPETGFVSIKAGINQTIEFDARSVSSKTKNYYGIDDVTNLLYVVKFTGGSVTSIYIFKKNSPEGNAIRK
jgi:hypothetical protein